MVQSTMRYSKSTGRIIGFHNGDKHPLYLKNPNSLSNIHRWVNRHHAKTGKCEQCHVSKKTDYAKIYDRDYTRNREDYFELCRKCHHIYDNKHLRMKEKWKDLKYRKFVSDRMKLAWTPERKLKLIERNKTKGLQKK